ncbi:hypothetical protein NA57DRAFT_62192 [Rhizodiscina lignyota]|uniref:Uncharacterized protein n=1 Tax=Rhizodiscina lignyota TaxID=1504668 RepID=A0A9P4LZJ3_9PEZI|nr:hypothetical protein NA57DRAFT_62192 [Rhizodiscina lignyota]
MTAIEKRGYASRYYAKNWDSIFSKDRNITEENRSGHFRGAFGEDFDGIGPFLRDTKDSLPLRTIETVEEFCQGVRLKEVLSDAGPAESQHTAWLDERSYSTNNASLRRESCSSHLSAKQLYKHLKAPRFNCPTRPDADRRLIYIANINAAHVRILAETASYHQIAALKDTIWKHLCNEASIGVKIASKGFTTFQLGFFFPFYTLRFQSPLEAPGRKSPPRKWRDLSFLHMRPRKSQDDGHYVLHETQFSFTICGTDNSRWIAYAFDDTKVDDTDLRHGLSLTSDGVDIPCDPTAWNEFNDCLESNQPIWNPREYFLTIMNSRITQVLKEWEDIMARVERSLREDLEKNCHSSILSSKRGRKNERGEFFRKTLDWAVQNTADSLGDLQVQTHSLER